MISEKIKIKRLLASITIVFIYYFPVLIYEWTNVYLLRKNSIFFDSLLSLYDAFDNTLIGFWSYFHFMLICFTEGGLPCTIYVYVTFLLSIIVTYILLGFVVSRLKKKKN